MEKEILKECIEFMENGASIDEIFEYVEENTDLDPTIIINKIYKKQIGIYKIK